MQIHSIEQRGSLNIISCHFCINVKSFMKRYWMCSYLRIVSFTLSGYLAWSVDLNFGTYIKLIGRVYHSRCISWSYFFLIVKYLFILNHLKILNICFGFPTYTFFFHQLGFGFIWYELSGGTNGRQAWNKISSVIHGP